MKKKIQKDKVKKEIVDYRLFCVNCKPCYTKDKD